jgi:hypothetical protein
LNAASLASAPELQNSTRPGRPVSVSNSSASATGGSAAKKLLTWPSLPICSVTAVTTAGCAWPSAFTAMPDKKST